MRPGKITFAISLVAVAFLLARCAQQVLPEGGEVDREPPKIIYSQPLNETLNFLGKTIEMEFDEFVALKSAQQQLIVSPPLKHPVTFSQKGKKVIVDFTDTLYENTTYTFNFGNGIVDLTEGNPLDSNVFVFSTGDYLDSLEYQGTVRDAKDLKAVKDAWVMLFLNHADSAPKTELPRYFARTDENGGFHIKYIAPGAYKVFALEDANANYLYDSPTERIAFREGLVELSPPDTASPDTLDHTMYLFQEKPDTQFVASSAIVERNRLQLAFNRPPTEVFLSNFAGERLDEPWYREDVPTGDTVVWWFGELYEYDTLHALVSMDGKTDSLEVRIRERTVRGGKKDKEKDTRKTLPIRVATRAGKQDFFKPLMARATAPVQHIDTSLFMLVQGNDTLPSAGNVAFDFRKISLEYPWRQDSTYKLVLLPGAVVSTFGDTNDTVRTSFTITTKEDYGLLYVWHELPQHGHGYIWQLLGKDGAVVDEKQVSTEGEVLYEHLLPGSYSIKLIYDENGNGKWDTGDYDAKKQPEKVIFYNQPIEVRANWENELEWIVTDSPATE